MQSRIWSTAVMAASGFRGNDVNNIAESLRRWPLEYVSETEECICRYCGQVLIPNNNNETPRTHFRNCYNHKNNGLVRVFKDLRKVQLNFQVFNAEISEMKTQMETVKTEVQADHLRMKTELNKEILALKAEIKTEFETLKKGGENHDGARVAFDNKVKVLEDGIQEKMREMGAAQDMKMAEVNGRLTGVTETISTVVHSMFEGARGKPSADTNEMAPKKRETETLSEQLKTKVQDFQVLKRNLESEGVTDESSAAKKMCFPVEPSPSDQITIPMNCYNLVTHNNLFQPSFKWIIEGLKKKLEQKTLELSSEMFQWNGYPVHAKAKLELKPDNCVYLSLCLTDDGQARKFQPIPRVFYLLKDTQSKAVIRRHKCKCINYLSGTTFSSALLFKSSFGPKSTLSSLAYSVNEFDIHVEPFATTDSVRSYDGTLEWNLENYARRLHLEKKDFVVCQESPYFYTGPSGFRVQVNVYLKGIQGKGLLTARILFLTDKFDDELPKSFAHSTTVTLVNRKEPERNISKTIVEDIKDKMYYDLEVCQLKEVKNFIENDALCCKVVIKAQEKAI